MTTSRPGRALFLPTLLIVVLGGLAALLVITREGDPDQPEEEMAVNRGADAEAPAPLLEAPAVVREEEDAAQRETPPLPASTSTLLCLHHTGLRPLAGIHLWVGERSIAGPTGADGILSVETSLPPVVTVWGEGWTSLEVSGRELPDRALLAPADGTLEVGLNNRQLEHRVARFLLQPHRPLSVPDGPWKSTLVEVNADLYRAEKLPAGEYDVYFWVQVGRLAPRPITARAVRVEAGQRTEVNLDLESVNGPEHEDD